MEPLRIVPERRSVSVKTLSELLLFLNREKASDLSERDLAVLLFTSFKNTIRYNPESGGWCRFDTRTGKWIANEDHYIAHHASLVGNVLRAIAGTARSDEDGKILKAYAKKIESKKGLQAVLYFAAANPEARVKSARFDGEPNVLGVQNGAFNMLSGEFFTPKQDHYLTKSCDAAFNPFATCPVWMAVLGRIVGDLVGEEKTQMLDFLQGVAGQMLLYHTCRRRFYFFGGPPGTGKSVFTNTMMDILGPYGVVLPPEALMTSRKGGDVLRPEFMTLPGARMLLLSEAGDGQCFNDDVIKKWTGGDSEVARTVYQAPITFKVGALICLTGNSYPQSKSGGSAFMSRICIINFRNQVPQNEQDQHLGDKLRAEYAGILNWALLGAMKVIRGNSSPWPLSVVEDTNRYRNTADPVKMFVEECCRRVPGERVIKADLHSAYGSWCKENGYNALNAIRFNRRIEDMGFDPEVREHNRRCFGGISLVVEYSYIGGTLYRSREPTEEAVVPAEKVEATIIDSTPNYNL